MGTFVGSIVKQPLPDGIFQTGNRIAHRNEINTLLKAVLIQLGGMELTGLGRWEFYDACMAENAIVLAISTGEQRVYANILLTVGCA